MYPLLRRIDGVQWQARTVWHTLDENEGYAPEGARRGVLHVVEGVDLAGIADERYGVVLCSHVLEHLANPLLALAAWRRVTRSRRTSAAGRAAHAGHLRPSSRADAALEHMIEDLEKGTGEDDLTHLPETLSLHDRARDSEGADREEWERRRRENASTRVLHHHTFTTPSLLRLLDHAGLQLLAVADTPPARHLRARELARARPSVRRTPRSCTDGEEARSDATETKPAER